jgi:peptide/nickel transport system permease protein
VRRFILKRVLLLVATLFVVSVAAFLLPYVQTTDPARTILRSRVSDVALDPAAVEAVRRELGLDQPIFVQYGRWLLSAVRGDFGLSFVARQPVLALVASGLAVSTVLALLSVTVAFALAFPLGTLAALRPGKAVDNVTAVLAQAAVAIPTFAIAPIAILVFALWLRILPATGWGGTAMILPVGVLALRPTAFFLRVTRASMLKVLGSPYVTAARARGASPSYAVRHHVLRNGSLPVLTLSSFWLAGLIGGSVVVEVIFAIPGMGRLVYGAVINADVPLIQGALVCIVALVVSINTIADVAYGVLDPRIRMSGSES